MKVMNFRLSRSRLLARVAAPAISEDPRTPTHELWLSL